LNKRNTTRKITTISDEKPADFNVRQTSNGRLTSGSPFGKPELHGNTSPYTLQLLSLLRIGRAELHGSSRVRSSHLLVAERLELPGDSALHQNSDPRRDGDADISEPQSLYIVEDAIELDGTGVTSTHCRTGNNQSTGVKSTLQAGEVSGAM